jgi:hypothetical protein
MNVNVQQAVEKILNDAKCHAELVSASNKIKDL